MNTKILLFVDDDCHMAWAFGNDLLDKAQAANLQLRIYTDADQALFFIKNDKTVDVAYAIVDLWMQNKTTGEENLNKGNEIIESLSKLDPRPRIAVLSAHIDDKAKAAFEKQNILCFKKPTMSDEVFQLLVAKPKVKK